MTPSDPDRALEFDLERLRLITANRRLGATWAMIGRADGGKPAKTAKRDFKRAARQAGRQWRLQHNRES